MAAAEAASSAVTEAMSALSRMRFTSGSTSNAHSDRPSSGGSGYGYPGSVGGGGGGGSHGGVDAGTAAATLSALGCGMGNAELAALAGALQSSVGVGLNVEMGMGMSGEVAAAEAGRGDQAVLVGGFVDRLARRESGRGTAESAAGAAVGFGGEGGVASGGDGAGQTRAYRGSSLQSMLQLVNAGALTSDEFLANLAKGGLRSVLRQQQS